MSSKVFPRQSTTPECSPSHALHVVRVNNVEKTFWGKVKILHDRAGQAEDPSATALKQTLLNNATAIGVVSALLLTIGFAGLSIPITNFGDDPDSGMVMGYVVCLATCFCSSAIALMYATLNYLSVNVLPATLCVQYWAVQEKYLPVPGDASLFLAVSVISLGAGAALVSSLSMGSRYTWVVAGAVIATAVFIFYIMFAHAKAQSAMGIDMNPKNLVLNTGAANIGGEEGEKGDDAKLRETPTL